MAKAQKPMGAFDRRLFILRRILQDRNRPLPFAEIEANCGKTGTQSFSDDEGWFENNLLPVGIARGTFEFQDYRIEEEAARFRDHKKEKKAIAQAAAGLISCAIGASIQPVSVGPMPEPLQMRLHKYWRKMVRTVVLDSGTTTGYIARQLAARKHQPAARPVSLTIVSNGFDVINALQRTRHNVEIIGGTLERWPASIRGDLAERFFSSLGVRPDIAIVGAMSLNEDYEFCSLARAEAQIKRLLLASAQIRCIAIDSKKLLKEEQEADSSWVIATLFDSQIDIIITDEGIQRANPVAKAESRRQEFLQHARQFGVFLLTKSPVRDSGAEQDEDSAK